MSIRKNITKEDVEREYLSVPTTLEEAAKALGMTRITLMKRMREFGIPSKSSFWNMPDRNTISMVKKEILDPKIIQDEYLDKPVTQGKAAKTIGCSIEFLRKSMAFHKINAKSRSWNPKKHKKFPELDDKDWLIEQRKTKTYRQIANELGTTIGNVASSASRYGLSAPGDNKGDAVKEGIRKRFPLGRTGDSNPAWNGGKYVSSAGYIYVLSPGHPEATLGGYVLEHRLVMEKSLGRFLTSTEVIHHRNNLKDDNRIENLELFPDNSKHREYHRKVDKLKAEAKRVQDELHALGINPEEQKPIE